MLTKLAGEPYPAREVVRDASAHLLLLLCREREKTSDSPGVYVQADLLEM